ncbi:GGDEF domain-containing protein [Desulfosarcina sp. OttesenSCG-928-G10]|nr:GGDEF domain-containing protein [Desulfosarcina sp. OttesenSCG-928-G10]
MAQTLTAAGVGFWQVRCDVADEAEFEVSEAVLALTGLSRKNFPDLWEVFLHCCVHPNDQPAVAGFGLLTEADAPLEVCFRLYNAQNKGWRRVRMRGKTVAAKGAGKVVFGSIVANAPPETAPLEARVTADVFAAMDKERLLLKDILYACPLSFIVSVDDKVEYFTPITHALLGIQLGVCMAGCFVNTKDWLAITRELDEGWPVTWRPVKLKTEEGIEQENLINAFISTFNGRKAIMCWCMDVTELNESQREIVSLTQTANTDYLSDLLTRRAMNDLLCRQCEDMQDGCGLAFLIMLDIDHFKKVNDTYGHDVGDLVLKAVSEIIRTIIGSRGATSRWGGEEFMAMIACETRDEAVAAAMEILHQVENTSLSINDQHHVKVTISAGLARLEPAEDYAISALKADKALYAAKNGGRNCLKCWPLSEAEQVLER